MPSHITTSLSLSYPSVIHLPLSLTYPYYYPLVIITPCLIYPNGSPHKQVVYTRRTKYMAISYHIISHHITYPLVIHLPLCHTLALTYPYGYYYPLFNIPQWFTPKQVVYTRRTKYMAISALTPDYMDSTGWQTSTEGELDSGNLISFISQMGQIGVGAGTAFATTFGPPIRSNFKTAQDYRYRFYQYMQRWGWLGGLSYRYTLLTHPTNTPY